VSNQSVPRSTGGSRLQLAYEARYDDDGNDAEADEDVSLGLFGRFALDIQGAISCSEVEGGVPNPTRCLGKDHAEL